jgi:hypothetical protein
MMYNIENLKRTPQPELDSKIVKSIIIREIEKVKVKMGKKEFIPCYEEDPENNVKFFWGNSSKLFHADGEGAGYSEIEESADGEYKVLGKIKVTDYQNVLLETMQEYGFDENNHGKAENKSLEEEVNEEVLDFQSSIPGLVFRRTVKSDKKSKDPISIDWKAVDIIPDYYLPREFAWGILHNAFKQG